MGLGSGFGYFSLGWIYTIFLYVIQNMLIWNVIYFGSEWGKGWATLTNSDICNYFQVYIPTPRLVISNYEPFRANLLVIIIMGLLLGMLGMLMFWLNFYVKIAGPIVASGLVFLSLAAVRIVKLYRFSPVSWIRIESHYRITSSFQPTEKYIIGMLVLWTILFLLLAKRRANATQENNRRNVRWKKTN